MFLNELKIFFENIHTFRGILNESVSANIFVDAIENNKYLYIYYASPDTTLKGYRIIKPFVIGKTKDGNTVVRAWQESGSSDSFSGLKNRRRNNHEYQNHTDPKTKRTTEKPAWRLFRLDYITSALPTGKHFSVAPEDIPDEYNAADKQMTGGIIASVRVGGVTNNPETQTPNGSNIDKIEPVVTTPETQTALAQEPLEIHKPTSNPNDIKDFYNAVTKVKHKPARNFIVVNDKNGVSLRNANDTRVPKESIIGNLADLYAELNAPKVINDKSFRDNIHKKAVNYFDSLKK
jgi:hypothetical protein